MLAALVLVGVTAGASVRAGVSVGASASEAPYQLGVLGDGFVAASRVGRDWRVTELDDRATPVTAYTSVSAADARLFGSPAGALFAYIDNNALVLERARDRHRGASFPGAAHLCESPAASNAERFGVAFLDTKDRVIVVHGPTVATAHAEVLEIATAKPKSWCGVASAGRDLMLMWRAGDRMYFNACNDRSCRGPVTSIALPASTQLLGAGCTYRAGCLVATRDGGTGAQQLALVTPAGGIKWRVPLDAHADTISIVGAGDRAFAVGYPGGALGIDRDGTITPLLSTSGDTVVAFARGRVLIAAGRTFTSMEYAP